MATDMLMAIISEWRDFSHFCFFLYIFAYCLNFCCVFKIVFKSYSPCLLQGGYPFPNLDAAV